jgi:hypothetical protein
LFKVSKGNCSVTTVLGTTVIVKCIDAPAHPSFVATTVNVETKGDAVVLVAIKDGTLPKAETGIKPMSGIGAVRLHCILAPGMLLENTTDGTVAPTQ